MKLCVRLVFFLCNFQIYEGLFPTLTSGKRTKKTKAGEVEYRDVADWKPVGAAYHTLSFGWELDLSLRNSFDPCTLGDLVQNTIAKELRNELYFGQVPQDEDERIVAVSHGYAPVAKMALMSQQRSQQGGGGESELPPFSLDLGKRALPGRAFADPAMANTRSIRAARIPSFNAYGSARALCDHVERSFSALPRRVYKEMSRVHTTEQNGLLGNVYWGLGFQLVRGANLTAFVHHVLMGGIVVCIPQTGKTIVVLCSDLTVDRDLTKKVIDVILEEEEKKELADRLVP